ncbi:hypothetical protein B9Z55_007460 [Caenorhabditis nigoni]|uniref:Uncharacterized protein n=1 Tax=Caenorhabditis nigoni TaxID=1611254 RepID=A0A2G5V9R7_9PELO|nr:hypothetical protein B9Z55_007460 [Caenorhabditis nigoni]
MCKGNDGTKKKGDETTFESERNTCSGGGSEIKIGWDGTKAVKNAAAVGGGRGRGYFAVDQSGRSFENKLSYPDTTVEKLLEIAIRFQVLSVIGIVEHHLMHISRIRYEKNMMLGDEYGMPKRIKNLISEMNLLEKAKKLETSPEFEKLSDRTRSLILARLLKAL